MPTISYKPSSNRMDFSGNIVADATTFDTKKGTGVNFRLAHNQGKDRKPIFMDIVMYGSEKNPIPHDLLKKGKYVKVSGSYFETERTGADGTVYTNRGIKAFSVEEIKTVTMQLSDDGKTATVIEDEDMPE